MLSFIKTKTSKPIATVNGGKHNGSIIYLDENESNQIEYVPGNKILNDKLNKELTIKDGSFFMYPDIEMADAIYISGPRGSGKSTFVSKYLKLYKQLHKKNDIYLFTDAKEDDPAFKPYKIKRIPIDERLIDEPIQLDELHNSLIIFDDVDAIESKKLEEAVIKLQKMILKYGRKPNVSCLSTRHKTSDYQKTADLLNESSSIVLFPKSGSAHFLKRALHEYIGLSNEQIKKVLSLSGRWIQIHQNYPKYCISENKIFLL